MQNHVITVTLWNCVDLQDGLGDTIRVSLTEPPEEEIDPCRRMANLGTRAAQLQQGVVRFYKFN